MSIRCGSCDGTHETVREVRSCYETPVSKEPEADEFHHMRQAETSQPSPPTDKQVEYLRNLAIKKASEGFEERMRSGGQWTKAGVSRAIDELKRLPDLAKPKRYSDDREEPPEGIHRFNDVIYKVQQAHHGSGQLYAKELNTEGKVGFHYVGRTKEFWSLSHDTLMSLEEAQQFGKLYGFCCVCARILTDEKSIALGIGPICGGRVLEWAS